MPVSPGPATNSAMSASVQHEQRATSPEAGGKIVTPTAGANATAAAHAFEQRASGNEGAAH
jgi:hypothetical protein